VWWKHLERTKDAHRTRVQHELFFELVIYQIGTIIVGGRIICDQFQCEWVQKSTVLEAGQGVVEDDILEKEFEFRVSNMFLYVQIHTGMGSLLLTKHSGQRKSTAVNDIVSARMQAFWWTLWTHISFLHFTQVKNCSAPSPHAAHVWVYRSNFNMVEM